MMQQKNELNAIRKLISAIWYQKTQFLATYLHNHD